MASRRARRVAWLTGVLALAGLISIQSAQADPTAEDLIAAGHERTRHPVRYDGRYLAIPYPGGDVPAEIGVCTDVIVRAFRAVGIDLQQRVHEDMRADFDAYPSRRIWGLTRPDPNIDHRRVPNLQAYFSRHGQVLPVTDRADNYAPGDLVTWMLPGNLPHIGLVSDRHDPTTGHPLIIHNIGQGPSLEDALFDHPITGHYRYLPDKH